MSEAGDGVRQPADPFEIARLVTHWADEGLPVEGQAADQMLILSRELLALRRELERWRHGNTVEGDFVCPNELEAVNLRAENERLRAGLVEALDGWSDFVHEENFGGDVLMRLEARIAQLRQLATPAVDR